MSTFLFVVAVAGILVLMGALIRREWTRRTGSQLGAIVLLVSTLAAFGGHQCLRESNYYCIKVVPGPQPGVRTLVLDLLVHGYVDMRDPTHLLYAYEQLYQEILTSLPPGSERATMLRFAFGCGA